jgi:hypothetical protein
VHIVCMLCNTGGGGVWGACNEPIPNHVFHFGPAVFEIFSVRVGEVTQPLKYVKNVCACV